MSVITLTAHYPYALSIVQFHKCSCVTTNKMLYCLCFKETLEHKASCLTRLDALFRPARTHLFGNCRDKTVKKK